MDSSSWIHGYADSSSTSNGGFLCGYAASCVTAGLQCREEEEEEQLLVSPQIQHHLNQISMHMNMDDEPVVYVPSGGGAAMGSVLDDLLPSHYACGAFPSSSSSSSLRSASLSCSPESSAHVLAAPVAAAAGADAGRQYPEVSSQIPLPTPVLPYDDRHQYMSLHDTAAVAPEMTSTSSSAFRRYARHLGPRRRPKPGACGQRMFKTAMSVLDKMHVAMRYSHQQYYYQQASAAAAPPSVNQLQHVISERKRREKLNDSFHALKTVLPPGSKKDKTSILIKAREYVNSLKSKVCELEEKNQALESRLARHADDAGADTDKDKIEIQITRAAAAEEEICTLKIAVRSACGNMTDLVLRTMQCLKDQMGNDVSLVAMSTSGGAAGHPLANLTLQLKSTSGVKWEEAAVKQAVAKVVAGALPLQSAEKRPPRMAPMPAGLDRR